jgi:hypothetical protein
MITLSGSKVVPADKPGGRVAYPPQEQSFRQVQQILQSAAFRNSHTLQQLLQFLVDQAYGPDAEKLKEYTIGVEAFSRPQDFDPKTDPIVRVQTHRLRQKLKEYYETDGRNDPILIEIPKGHYLPTFTESSNGHVNGRPSLPGVDAGSSNGDPIHGYRAGTAAPQSPRQPGQMRRMFSRRNVMAGALAAALFALGLLIGSRQLRLNEGTSNAAARADTRFNPATNPVKAFWANVVGNDETPIIAHADAIFLLDSHNDLFFFPHGASDYRGAPVDPQLAQKFAADPALVAKAGELYYEDVYLGSGDLDAVAILSNLFGRMGLKPIIEAGKQLTPEDFEQHNVILVGSSFQSYAVSQFNSEGDFTFVNPIPQGSDWAGTIVNSHPRPGEKSVYHTERDPVTGVLKMDHALITIQPGVVPGRYVVDLGGLDTTGCAGAARFATSATGVEELKKSLNAQGIHDAKGAPPLFQALLSVRLEKGDEVLGTSLLTVHPLYPSSKASPSPNGSRSLSRQKSLSTAH